MNQTKSTLRVSVIIPAYNEERYIGTVLEELLQQDYPPEFLEVLVVDGGSQDRTQAIVRAVAERVNRVRLLIGRAPYVPANLNLAIRAAHGDCIIRLDAHASYPSNYVSTLVGWQERSGAENVGCFWVTRVDGDGALAQAIELAHALPVGVGNAQFRLGTETVQEVDTVPFGCYRREVFERIGLFHEQLYRNQDIELNKRLKKAGGRILLVPDVSCTYYAPSTLRKVAAKCYANGLWNMLTVGITRSFGSLSLRHYVPGVFVLSLVLPLLVGLFWWPASLAALASALVYSVRIGVPVVRVLVRRPGVAFALPLVLLTMHVTYGVGSLIGSIKMLWVLKAPAAGSHVAAGRLEPRPLLDKPSIPGSV